MPIYLDKYNEAVDDVGTQCYIYAAILAAVSGVAIVAESFDLIPFGPEVGTAAITAPVAVLVAALWFGHYCKVLAKSGN